ITQNIWKIILAESRRYIDTAWASEVIPEYNDHILNRFPVFKNSLSDISINDFNHFFGPNGAVEMFFNHYLQPFVDTTQAYWTWKEVDGETLPIPQTKLDMLTRASMIQKMFYADNRKTPTLKFTLTPISLSPNVSRFALNIGGQRLAFEPGIKSPLKATWPGPDGNFVTFQFDTLSPDKPAKTLTGTWAWLRLLNLADLEATSDPKIFHLSLSLEGNTARYQLIAHSPINPYSAQLLSAFRCPNEL
ncbi:type VI secretion IcmF C-terminal domain-containing protein, partial [Coxiella burnetii]